MILVGTHKIHNILSKYVVHGMTIAVVHDPDDDEGNITEIVNRIVIKLLSHDICILCICMILKSQCVRNRCCVYSTDRMKTNVFRTKYDDG